MESIVERVETARPGDWAHRRVAVDGIGLHYVEAGAGRPVVLLHGFPEFWYSWRHQLPALADAGFRALAIDLRGYNESDKPAGVDAYRPDRLTEDVAELIRRAAGGRAFVVGHDWGGVVAWRLAARHPDLVDKLAVLNATHPAAYRRERRRNFRQWLRSWYVLFFQLPWLPERVLRAGDYALLARALRRQPVRPGAFSAEDVARYKEAWARPGALTAALNYYRAAFRHRAEMERAPQVVRVPVLVVWGERDPYLGVELTEGLGRWAPDLRVERIADASHWVQNDAPEKVNRLLADFFGGRAHS
jgi:pimeloyl-ACP methyl ester carboxylesterase